MKVLLIEDESHKREELKSHLESIFNEEMNLAHVDSVRDAVLAVSERQFDLIVLDMALPTFSHGGRGSEGGHDQALGGIEVLRTLRSREAHCAILIITQYPDITLNGKRIRLNQAAAVLSHKYAQNVIGAILYKYKGASNKAKITAALKLVK